MNKKINCLTSSQLDLYRSHIDYILDNNMMERVSDNGPFANTHQQYGDVITELLLHYLKLKIQNLRGLKPLLVKLTVNLHKSTYKFVA